MVGGNSADGKKLREQFINNTPSFKSLKDQVQRASTRGYVKGLDGRRILIRHPHASLNTLLLGGGAIVRKKALSILDDSIKLNTLDSKFVANIHDEWQLEVKTEQSDFVGRLGVEALTKAGEYYNMRCPLTGEYKLGESWDATH